MPDGSGLGQFADIARDNEATISVAPSALIAFISHSLGPTAQAIIFSALCASSLLHSETDSKIRQAPWVEVLRNPDVFNAIRPVGAADIVI